MPDPLNPNAIGELIEKAGITVASVVGLIVVVKWLSQVHLKALNDRITALESALKEKDQAIAERDKKIEKLHERMISIMEVHAHDMQSVALRMINESVENRKFQREIHEATVKTIEAFRAARPCLIPEYHPHPTPHPEIQVPAVPITEKTTGRA